MPNLEASIRLEGAVDEKEAQARLRVELDRLAGELRKEGRSAAVSRDMVFEYRDKDRTVLWGRKVYRWSA